MVLLFPGRHHLLTRFQYNYLARLVTNGINNEVGVNGHPIKNIGPVEAVVFPITSANHANTRRNPVPFYLRALAIERFCSEFKVPSFIYGIDDVGALPDFATYTIKRIAHLSDGQFSLNPENTLVLCSTPVLKMYEALGYRILPVELIDRTSWSYCTDVPWSLVERIAGNNSDWRDDEYVVNHIHPASFELWSRYNLGEKVRLLFSDSILGDDGDITTTRDYNSYVRQMDEIAHQKFSDTAAYIRPGRIGDIGCAVGSWLKFVANDERFHESDLYGIEVVRHLFDICEQRKHNGEFSNPFVFFSQKNAITGLVFEKGSMNTIHTSSLTHEIESYGGREDLQRFIRNRFEELAPSGVWINRDVVGPENADRDVYLLLNRNDSVQETITTEGTDQRDPRALSLKSTYDRYLVFAREFRQAEGYSMPFKEVTIDGTSYIKCSLRDACEFLSKKDYTDNWSSEMHETFCFWSFEEWAAQITKAGFKVNQESQAFTNMWIVDNRWQNAVNLFEMKDNHLESLAWPVTHMILIAQKV